MNSERNMKADYSVNLEAQVVQHYPTEGRAKIATGSATQALIAGVIAAAQQYAGNYMSTGSGFSMSSGGGVTVLSAAQTEASVSAGPNLFGMFMNAFMRAPAAPSTVGGMCSGACHTSGIAIPEVTPEVRAATTRFYQNLGEDFIPGLGPYRKRLTLAAYPARPQGAAR